MGAGITIEICANSLASALAAQEGGADRVELCDNLAEGGTTPSYGTLARTRELLHIQLYPIIRPRGGDFLYDDMEMELMLRDIAVCRRLGCDGVVIGALDAEGHIALDRCRELIAAAGPLGVTFHRAFDRCREPAAALEQLIDLGCERVLSSGQQPSAPEGAALLAALVQQAGDRLAVMAGAGVREHNIGALVARTRAREYHSTAARAADSRMRFLNPLARRDAAAARTLTDPDLVRRLREEAERAWAALPS